MSVNPNSSNTTRQTHPPTYPVTAPCYPPKGFSAPQSRQTSQSRPSSHVSRIVRDIITMSSSKSRNTVEQEPSGLVYRIPELPRGHSCRSMVDMFQAMTEWAKENPGAGKRPDITTSRHDFVADIPQYPDGPESYRVIRQNTLADAAADRSTTRSHVFGGNALHVMDDGVWIESSGSDRKDHRRADKVKVVPLDILPCPPCQTETSSDANDSDSQTRYYQCGAFIHDLMNDPGAAVNDPGIRSDSHLSISKPGIPSRSPSHKSKSNSHDHRDQRLGVNLQPVRIPRLASTAGVAGSTLPEKVRVSRLEATAHVVRRRPVRSSQKISLRIDVDGGHGDLFDLVRFLDPDKPVGPPLSKEVIAKLHEPDLSRRCLSQQHYQPYRPACKVTVVPTTSRPITINLPCLPATSAFGKDEALQKLQHGLEKEMTEVKSSNINAVAQTSTPMVAVLPPTYAHCGSIRGHSPEPRHPAITPQPKLDKQPANTFSKTPSDGAALHLLGEESDFSPTDELMDVPVPEGCQAVEYPSMTEADVDTSCQDGHNTEYITSKPHIRSQVVKDKVELFEAKTRRTTGTEDGIINNLGGSFAWPRFSDRQYVDPASEYAQKWKEIRKTRRRGMIFDPREIELALQAGRGVTK